MKTKNNLSPLHWYIIIIFSGLMITGYLLAKNITRDTEIDFSCSSRFRSMQNIHRSQITFDGVLYLIGYSPDHFSLTYHGEMKTNSGQFIVNRKLIFRYTSQISPDAGVYMVTPEKREKKPDDNATDDIDYLLFDIYHGIDKLYLVKHINRETLIIGDSFSPRFACVINHLAD